MNIAVKARDGDMKNRSHERLSDSVGVRTTTRQRAFLEKMSYESRLSMGESIRILIDEAMERAGAV